MYEIFVELLKKKGISANQVCKATGIAPATISDWKNGKSKPKQDKLKLIADYFEVSLDYLTTGECSDAKAPISDRDVKLALFGGDDEVTDEMWEEALFAVELIKQRHKRKE